MKRVIPGIVFLGILLLSSCGGQEETAVSSVPAEEVQISAEPTPAPTVLETEPSPERSGAVPKRTSSPAPKKTPPLAGRVICIDAGHGVTSLKGTEPVAPDASVKKAKHVSGASGAGTTEEQLNLQAAKKLQTVLAEKGASVVMTRTAASCDLSNVERAQKANRANADLMIRIHADGVEDSSVHGISMLVPSGEYIKDKKLISESRRAGELILAEVVSKTGAKNRGISPRSDMTGFNWSEVPVVLIEMGFITNAQEEARMMDSGYQDKIAAGIAEGIEKYFR